MALISWWRNRTKAAREWRENNERSWAGFDIPREDGLTEFQDICRSQLAEIWPIGEPELVEGMVNYLHGKFEGTEIEYYIYEDGAELSGDGICVVGERWDFETPDDLIATFLSQTKEILKSNIPLEGDG